MVDFMILEMRDESIIRYPIVGREIFVHIA
jgi:hypothetical protein